MENEENKNNMEMKKTNKGKTDNKMLLFVIIIVVIIIISGIILYTKMSKDIVLDRAQPVEKNETES